MSRPAEANKGHGVEHYGQRRPLCSEGADQSASLVIDADEPDNPDDFTWAIRLRRPGTVIVGDNVVREGAVLAPDSDKPNVRGLRRFFSLVVGKTRLSATAIQMVGNEGWDNFALAILGCRPYCPLPSVVNAGAAFSRPECHHRSL